MSEVEFERLLDAVRTAIELTPEDAAADSSVFHLPQAANDNRGAWPVIPFPEGWNASC